MNQEGLTKFKALLDGMIEDLEEGASTTMEGMRGDAVPFPDPTDRANLESDRNLTLRIRDRERKLRLKIEEALSRIEDGSFGICEVCEEGISESRLTARPVTTLCINCKEDQEVDEEKHHLG
jgi:DnaK suppressor protein